MCDSNSFALCCPFFFTHSHRSRDEDRVSKAGPLPVPAKMVEEMPKEQTAAREEKQLPPLPGQRSLHMNTLWSNIHYSQPGFVLRRWRAAGVCQLWQCLHTCSVPLGVSVTSQSDTLLWWQFCVCACTLLKYSVLWSPQSPSLCTLNPASLTWTCLLVRQMPQCPASRTMIASYGAPHWLSPNSVF